LISCNEIVPASVRGRYRKTLVIHASDLPRGRGWSPYVWQVLEGKNRIPVTLLEAEDAVDSGAIWAQRDLSLEGHELFDEIAARLFELELELMEDGQAFLACLALKKREKVLAKA
jgi:methionyl-tRNA formyltransferase